MRSKVARNIITRIKRLARKNKGARLAVFVSIVARTGRHDHFTGMYFVEGNVGTVIKAYLIRYDYALETSTKRQKDILMNGIPIVFAVRT